ncbi:trypsin-like peptidase domain-containing protein [Nitrosomonas sp. Nm34]|uniref:trypsin-like peptidase domain-containing protein n=1 Tax=Nitrosomonas sp. Nm34 TaxID=1881055 RepID=UPI0008F061B9|nr:trypsin-like peptidase domain-containing protein [Nitrosomonas sp. Nm34]SFI17502.1 Trypsin-like peptidase domain-containing protein [Nitrosomonas sp. Nm34]
MKNNILKIAATVSLTLLWATSASAVRVESKQYNLITSRSTTTHDASVFVGTGEQAYIINLADISVDPASITGNKTGIILSLPSPTTASLLHWESIKGGYVARFRVFANEQIKRLRLHLTFEGTIPMISFRVQGNLDSSPIESINNSSIYDEEIWLPSTNGNSADLEIFVEGSSPEMLNFKIDTINLIVISLREVGHSHATSRSLKLTESEQYDLACWAGNAEYPALKAAAASTALIYFIDKESKTSSACTGTLLADVGGTFTPWFITANHCLSSQTEADSAEFRWYFQAITCGEDTVDFREHITSGAELLWSDSMQDVSFLKLRDLPPATILSGWDTDIQVGDPVWSVHHPNTDHTMVSFGKVTEFSTLVQGDDGKVRKLNTVKHEFGGTESGSSGSGLFTVENERAYWKGTLHGGPADDYKISYYSHFLSYYTNLKQWLADPAINCFLNWAEGFYPNLFSPRGAVTLESSPYTYRYYENTNAYVGFSSVDGHVYYLGPDGILVDVGNISTWLKEAGCS